MVIADGDSQDAGTAGRLSRFDTGVAHSARVWNYWLGGKDHFAADRAVGEQAARTMPSIRRLALADRAFLASAVGFLAGEAGIRQFLDIGTGLPTADNTHEAAQRIAPSARVVYVDNDPIVLAHARSLLTSSPEGVTAYIDADLRDPDAILEQASATLDFTQPVAVMLLGILLFIPDADDPHGLVARLVSAAPSGSYLAISHGAGDIDPGYAAEYSGSYNERSASPLTLRSHGDVSRFFAGTDLVDPGVVQLHRWRTSPDSPGYGEDLHAYCGLGRRS
ncbi:MAG TPA: SAM-dependent methyltransferase [Trebonia sp.]